MIQLDISLTFNVDLNVIRFAHSQLILSSTAIKSSGVPRDRAKYNFLLRTENAFEAFFSPKDGCGWVRVHLAPQSDRILFILKVAQRGCLHFDARRVCKKVQKVMNCSMFKT